MHGENDQQEIGEVQQVECDRLDANDMARRRVLECEPDLLHCEHGGGQAEAAAIGRCARIMEGWDSTVDPAVRRRLLEEVGRELMTVHEAPPAPLDAKEMPPNQLGAHTDADFWTEINERLLTQHDPKDALETYLHEYRHVEQHYEAQKFNGPGWRSVDCGRASAIEGNLKGNHYIQPQDGQAAYERQFVEKDAREFAADIASRILSRRIELRQAAGGGGYPSVTSDGDAMAEHRLASE